VETPRVFAATGRVWAGWGRGIGDKGVPGRVTSGSGAFGGALLRVRLAYAL